MTRGSRVESVHCVAACAADARGDVVASYGAIDAPVYVRSAAKPFIAAEIVRSGAADRFGFEPQELAVIAASHNGEAYHVAAVESILGKIGLDVSALRCGTHPPNYEPAAHALIAAGEKPSALHNNCSGKHAGILALCLQIGAPVETYLEPEHPVQRRILAFCARAFADDAERWPVAIDGCGIPIFATPLRNAARAFARLATFDGLEGDEVRALQRVRAAMLAYPGHVAGTGRFDTALMEAAAGAIACKAGAEGVHGSALLPQGLGLAVKVVDGTRRAAPPAVIATLRALGALDDARAESLGQFTRTDVYNVAGRTVGEVEARLPDTIRTLRT